ncbi:hypothetical protein ACFFGH_27555 [Lysobacter korlensis]|uniref:Cell division protein FtsL n=1 Tax=Lysobacter korlensis TaxID=553636 RepID=A0ABV6RX97_9GAMM
MSAAPVLAPAVDTLPLTPQRAPEQPARPSPTPVRPAPVEAAPREKRAARPRIRYAIVAVAGIFGILLAQLLLSMVVSEGAYEIQALQSANKELGRDVQQLTEAQQRLSSTQNLVANAAALGMVNDPNRVFLRLSDGAVLGSPVPASADNAAVTNSDLVSNVLVEDLPVAAAVAEDGKKAAADDPAVPGAADGQSADGGLASSEEGLPSPVTR